MEERNSETRKIEDRLRGADAALKLFASGEVPHLHEFVFGSTFEIREIDDPQPFQKVSAQDSLSKHFQKVSQLGSYIRVFYNKGPVVCLYLNPHLELTEAKSSLYSKCLRDISAMTYAAMGIDMKGIISLNDWVKSDG